MVFLWKISFLGLTSNKDRIYSHVWKLHKNVENVEHVNSRQKNDMKNVLYENDVHSKKLKDFNEK